MKCISLLAVMILVGPGLLLAQEVKEKKVNAKSVKEKKVDPSGTWRWEYDWQDAHVHEAFRFNVAKDGKVAGTLQRNEETFEIKDAKLKGNELSFSLSGETGGYEWKTDYVAKLNKDEMDGTVTLDAGGQTYEFPWTTKRSVLMEDVVGTWDVSIDASDGNTYTGVLKIAKDGDENYKSSYESTELGEMEIKRARVQKNKLTFTVMAEYDGNEMSFDFAGRPYGDHIKNGAIDYDIAGNIGESPFTAKRRRPKKEKADKADQKEK